MDREENGVMGSSADGLLSVVYSSTATNAMSEADLEGLLAVSRETNARTDVTGMLLHRSGRFIQVLEGPASSVLDRMSHITADGRHRDLRTLIEEPIQERQFPEWTMGYTTGSTSDGAVVPGYRATFDDLTVEEEPDSTTIRALRELIRWYTTASRSDTGHR